MRIRWKRHWFVFIAFALVLVLLFLPGLPWSARTRHSLKRAVIKSRMKLASWQGVEPRLIRVSGRIDAPGAGVLAVDSRSGWASLADGEGNFLLRDVMWYPNAEYDLVISKDESAATMTTVRAPSTFPESGRFNAGNLGIGMGSPVELESVIGNNSITFEDFDFKNIDYYKDLFATLTSGKQSDEERIIAINDFVASKLNYNETQFELGSPRRVLERGSQFCGHLTNAMRTLLATGGYHARGVNIIDDNDPPGTHVVVEAFYEGGWHLYDPTYGVRFLLKDGEVASYRDVRLDPSLISDDLFVKLDPQTQSKVLGLLRGCYRTGCFHLYDFKSKP
jgi:transglutaminase-like putative cysteine protease